MLRGVRLRTVVGILNNIVTLYHHHFRKAHSLSGERAVAILLGGQGVKNSDEVESWFHFIYGVTPIELV